MAGLLLPEYRSMRQGRPLARRTPLRQQSPKQAARQKEWSKITRSKIERGETCVDAHLSRCAGPLDGDHEVQRSLGGKWDESNHSLRCRKHHDLKHGTPWHDEEAV